MRDVRKREAEEAPDDLGGQARAGVEADSIHSSHSPRPPLLRYSCPPHPMRIIVNGRFLGRAVTGVERYARALLERFADRVTVLHAPAPSGVAGHLWEQLWIAAARHADERLWSPANTGPLLVGDQVVTLHDLSPLDHPEWFDRRFAAWYGWLLPRLAARVRHILTVSEFSRGRIVERLRVAPEKVTVIANGVGPEFKPVSPGAIDDFRRQSRLPPRYVLAIGSIDPRKNIETLLRAWPFVRAAEPDAELILVGRPSPSFRGRATAALPEGVRRIGVDRTGEERALAALYSGAQALAFPSLYEGFGLPLLEAMACGTPVVCGQVGGVPEVVGDAALWADPLRVDMWAEAIVRLLQDAMLRDELRERGLRRSAQFSWDRAAESAWKVLQTP
ncbi:MAG: glycosyltransferase family 4 protein [Acidobacteria bacterium]|nr:glycosyltransferase family 4 protein [Acidobacteriota bacterium]